MANGDRHRTPGEVLDEVEGDLGTRLRSVVRNYYRGKDRGTAQAIREVTLEEATAMVEAMRVGRLQDVALVASAVSGVGVGLLAQKALDLRVRGVSPWAAVGLAAATIGAAVPMSFKLRAMVAVGGLSFAAGNYLWTQHRPHEGGAP